MAVRKARPRAKTVAPRGRLQMINETVQLIQDAAGDRFPTASGLMRRAGLSRNLFTVWRMGGSMPSLAALYKLARALGCSIHDLVPKR